MPSLRAEGMAYRIVGFEVDPRSVSIESLQLKTDKDVTDLKGKDVDSEAKCVFPKEVQVAEIKKKEKGEFCSMCVCCDMKLCTMWF